MHILHINSNYTGTQLHQTMIEHLEGCGIENDIFVATYNQKESVIIPNENVIISECFQKWDRIIWWYKQRKILNAIQSAYKLKKFDLIHAHTVFTDGNCAREMAKNLCIPYIVAVRNTDINTFFKRAFWLRNRGIAILKDAAAIIFLSPAYKEQLKEKYIPKEYVNDLEKKSFVIPNGIDDFWIQNRNLKKDMNATLMKIKEKKLRLIYVGTIDKNKNIDLTLKALYILRTWGYEADLLAVGKVEDMHECQKINDHSFALHMQAKPKEKLIQSYRECDIFVMPSHTETFGLVYAEAMSQGLPVIYTRGQGFDGQFAEGEVGFSTSDKDARELARRISDAAAQYERLSRNCLRQCEKFDWGQIAFHYKNIYNQVTNGMEGK